MVLLLKGRRGTFQTPSRASPERQEFYNFIIGLDAMKESLSKGGTITIDKDSPIYDILINKTQTAPNIQVPNTEATEQVTD